MIGQMVREAMKNAKVPREMFRVCEKFNKLFVRDRIRAAVWDFSSELLDNIEREVKFSIFFLLCVYTCIVCLLFC